MYLSLEEEALHLISQTLFLPILLSLELFHEKLNAQPAVDHNSIMTAEELLTYRQDIVTTL